METVSDGDAFTVMRNLAKSEGLAVEPAAAVAFAGMLKLAEEGIFKPEQTIVINCTGHTFPVEKHVLGDQWSVDIAISQGKAPAAPQERPDPRMPGACCKGKENRRRGATRSGGPMVRHVSPGIRMKRLRQIEPRRPEGRHGHGGQRDQGQ